MTFDELPPERKERLLKIAAEKTDDDKPEKPAVPDKSALRARDRRMLAKMPSAVLLNRATRKAHLAIVESIDEVYRWIHTGKDRFGKEVGPNLRSWAMEFATKHYGGHFVAPATMHHKIGLDNETAGVVTALAVAAARGTIKSNPEDFKVKAVDAEYEVSNGNGNVH